MSTEQTRHALEAMAVKIAPRDDRSISPYQLDRVQDVTWNHASPSEVIREAARPGTAVGRGVRMPNAGCTISYFEHGAITPVALLASQDPTTATSVVMGDFRAANCDIILPMQDDGGSHFRDDYLVKQYLSSLVIDARAPDSNIAVDATFDGSYWYSLIGQYLTVYEHTVTAGEEAAGFFDIAATYPVPVLFDNDENTDYFFSAHTVSGGVTSELAEVTDFSISTRRITSTGLVEGDTWVLHYMGGALPTGGTLFDAVNDSDLAEVTGSQVDIVLYESATSRILTRLESARINLGLPRERLAQLGDKMIYAQGLTDMNVTVDLGAIDTDARRICRLLGHDPDSQKLIDHADAELTGIDFELRIWETTAKSTFLHRYIVSDVYPQSRDSRSGGPMGTVRGGLSLTGTNFEDTTVEPSGS